MLLWDLNACRLTRTISGDSTEVDGAWLEPTFSRTFSGNSVMEWEEFCADERFELMELCSEESKEEGHEVLIDEDLMVWNITTGQGFAQQKSDYDKRLDSMLASLDEVKDLYVARYGRSLSDVGEDEEVYDADGMPWKVVVGRGVAAQKASYEEKMDEMTDSLAEIKSLFEAKYGYPYDDDEDEEEEEESYDSHVDRLLAKLEEVKELHTARYGRALSDLEEDEEVYDSEGTAWKVTVGRGFEHEKSKYEDKMEGLDDSLAEVKLLFEGKYGYSCDDEEESGRLETGRGIAYQKQVYESRIDALLSQLEEVKDMHVAKYGRSVDDIEEDEEVYDSDGMAWKVVVGKGFVAEKAAYEEKLGGLNSNLDEVKMLFEAKYGYSADDDSEEEELAGRVHVGRGFAYQKSLYDARLESMTKQLAEVKTLYAAKHGRTLSDLEDNEEVFDSEGMSWKAVVGEGFQTQSEAYQGNLNRLDDSLAEVKELFQAKYGYAYDDSDDEEEEEEEEEEEVKTVIDSENMVWHVQTSTGFALQKQLYDARIESLTQKLEGVKEMHVAKYGRSLSDIEEGELVFDQDGTPWTVILGTGATTTTTTTQVEVEKATGLEARRGYACLRCTQDTHGKSASAGSATKTNRLELRRRFASMLSFFLLASPRRLLALLCSIVLAALLVRRRRWSRRV